ncbi:MAG: aspartate--tRNA ligase [Clostridiales bacterium]|jgi:aspartyl-tRNA synthetase|nr:aspartate--tRNA ligase [Clostridiales bacterium]MCK9350277.1 aspartate--tRNA ligase [Clostridiales bacterium]MDY0119992.1 aspartate--tRNA ligase [Clostridia bacterium]NLG29922.1 aspartate--tRNA ligase [Clostridiaceae bacterium]
MSESMGNWRRSCLAGDVSEAMVGEELILMGWCHKQRDLGGLLFITLRDIAGEVQIVVDDDSPLDVQKKATLVRGEYVLAVKGNLRLRSAVNPDMKTGTVELHAQDLRILSESETPPFYIEEDIDVNENLRLKYRFLDLRRPGMQQKLLARHRITKITRDFFDREGFIDVETPTLIKSTPEGARDYLVPSRVFPGRFFALPQSPQLYKQLLMLAGYNKYMQIARCFRDEDLRADRQPEFTQIDIEMAFVGEEDVLDVNERFLQTLMREFCDFELTLPIRRITWRDAMARFGSDKPDLRFGMEIADLSDLAQKTDFQVFKNAIDEGGIVAAIAVPGGASMSRRELDGLSSFVKQNTRAKGLSWLSLGEDGESKGSVAKFCDASFVKEALKRANAAEDAQLLIGADADRMTALESLGDLRIEVAKRRDLIPEGRFEFCWVTEFPLLEWSEETERYVAKHHPFTSPMEEDIEMLDTNPGEVRARAYDMVLNGTELGGGSIRIHRQDLQKRMFKLLGFTEEQAEEQFGFLLSAFRFGVPPHGGLAYGLDRIVMLLVGEESIREVIAFPKIQNSSSVMTGAPYYVAQKQLDELGLAIAKKDPDEA